jgi:tripartite-type tricarboxylate transporter receptor subunit TctC
MSDRICRWIEAGRRAAGALLLVAAMVGLAASLAAAPAAAEKYPRHPVRIIVPFPAGGPTDLIARLLAERLASALGQPFTVENHPGGASGTVAVKLAADAPPDGYTLFLGSPGPLAIGPAVYANFGYDPAKTFVPVAMLAISPQVLVVNPTLPARSVHDLIAYARANPGKISFASPGFGTEPHLLGELLKTTAGIAIVHVPYKGSAPAIQDLVAGHVQMSFDGPAVIAPYIAANRLHALAVASETRARLLPDVPTMIESGFGRFIANYWSAIVAPVGTPAKLVMRLNGAINDILRSSDMQAALAKLGAEPKVGTPQDAVAFMSAEAAKWAVIAKAAGIRADEIAIDR